MKNWFKPVVAFLSTLAPFYVLWLVFVGTFETHELLIGILAATLASTGMMVIVVRYPVRFSPGLSDLVECWRLPWYLLSDTCLILAAATFDVLGIERAGSLFRVCSFDACPRRDPHNAARRALATVYSTVAPNSIVLGVNSSNQKLLFHQIKPSSVPKMTKQLGARP